MSTVTIYNSPLHIISMLTAVYGETGSNWSNYHTGIDFVSYLGVMNPNLYSVCVGVVIKKEYDTTLGYQIVIQDTLTGNYWRYCHMKEESELSVGDSVDTYTKVGILGGTGNVTGDHLHLEYSTSEYWGYDYFLNPADALGIPNERYTIIIYDGDIPTYSTKKNKFPWQLISKKLRQKRRNR